MYLYTFKSDIKLLTNYRCTVLLVHCECLNKFKNILIDILTVCMNEYDGKMKDSLETNTPAEDSRIRLMSLIKGKYISCT